MSSYDETNQLFVTTLVTLCEKDRGFSAGLRQWWSPATRMRAFSSLGRMRAIGNDPRTLVAALYAVHPDHQEGKSVGAAALRLDAPGDDHCYRAHFRRLIACEDLDDLGTQLHRLVKRLKQEGISLDYARLLGDLGLWGAGYSQNVKTRWAEQFWQAPEDLTTSTPTP